MGKQELYEYYCTKCHVKITYDAPGYVECPECKSGSHIRDCGDYEPPIFDTFRNDYNWNKP